MMNSLPRLFGKKKEKGEKKPVTIEISEPFAPVHREGVSSISQSLASLNSLSSVGGAEENENLYVNGQVPRGQFKEYFMPPESNSDHKFKVPQLPKSRHVATRAESVRISPRDTHVTLNSGFVKRSASIRSNIIVTNSFMNDKKFVRHGSGRNSQLKKSLSMDDVLEESINKSEEEVQNNYYNVQYVGKSSTGSQQLILNRENLHQHDQIYMNKLGLTGAAEPETRDSLEPRVCHVSADPLSTSYLGHTLISQCQASDISDKADNDSDDESKDSGAVSMGGGSYIHLIILYLGPTKSGTTDIVSLKQKLGHQVLYMALLHSNDLIAVIPQVFELFHEHLIEKF